MIVCLLRTVKTDIDIKAAYIYKDSNKQLIYMAAFVSTIAVHGA